MVDSGGGGGVINWHINNNTGNHLTLLLDSVSLL
jgi:hypothetical protein